MAKSYQLLKCGFLCLLAYKAEFRVLICMHPAMWTVLTTTGIGHKPDCWKPTPICWSRLPTIRNKASASWPTEESHLQNEVITPLKAVKVLKNCWYVPWVRQYHNILLVLHLVRPQPRDSGINVRHRANLLVFYHVSYSLHHQAQAWYTWQSKTSFPCDLHCRNSSHFAPATLWELAEGEPD